MSYRFEATSLEGFVQHLAANLLPHGYFFYVRGRVPDGKDPAAIDRKMMGKYGVDLSPSARSRRKRAGLANLHYLRFGREWVLVATHGRHDFFEAEAANVRDVRKVALKVGGYSLRVVRGGYLRRDDPDEPAVEDGKLRVRVAIGRERYLDLKAHFLELATRLPADELARAFYAIPFEPYAPVRVQLFNLLRWVNKARHAAGLERLPASVLRTKRTIVKPFELPDSEGLAA
ncbi:MAG: hypothetical protein K2X82_02080 [Gemmataceae bacterium]|nr:hypothetical protein [Gemmataceae bacterium]